MNKNFNDILTLFELPQPEKVTELKKGHSNRTYEVEIENSRYILQSLNGTIFKFPDRITRNIQVIESTFEKFPDCGIGIPEYLTSGGKTHVEFNGEIWRIYKYIESSGSCVDKNFQHGFAIGTFLRVVNSSDVEFENCMPELHDFNIPGLPKRNIHGDTKADNVIFGTRPTVIDLDTTMRDHVFVDYGDMIRSLTTKGFDIEVIGEATAGFAKGLDGMLTAEEVKSLELGADLIISELMERYYQGYQGMNNFPNKTPEQCLERSREHVLQLKEFHDHKKEVADIIEKSFWQ